MQPPETLAPALMRRESRRKIVGQAFAGHYANLCRLAYVMTADAATAEEIVMDVFADTLRTWRPLDGSNDVLRYLRRGVVNRCNTATRRRATERTLYARVAAGVPAAAPAALDIGQRDLIADAVSTLPKRQRAAVVLTYYLDLPVAETAEVMGCSVGTVKSQLSKARAHLSHIIERSP